MQFAVRNQYYFGGIWIWEKYIFSNTCCHYITITFWQGSWLTAKTATWKLLSQNERKQVRLSRARVPSFPVPTGLKVFNSWVLTYMGRTNLWITDLEEVTIKKRIFKKTFRPKTFLYTKILGPKMFFIQKPIGPNLTQISI